MSVSVRGMPCHTPEGGTEPEPVVRHLRIRVDALEVIERAAA
jgi:hypothetical protein